MATTPDTEASFCGGRTVRTGSSPEYAALLACVRIDVLDDELFAHFARVRDWPGLKDLAIRQAVLPMLYSCVARTSRDLAPPATLEELRLINQANAERCIRHTVTLLSILGSLRSHGISAVPFKGPLLSEYAYGDVTMRYFQDLDLFVARSDFVNASRLLESLGFRSERRLFERDRTGADDYHDIFQGHGSTVELHWRTGPAFVPPVFQADELLRRARPAALLGQPVSTLDPADLLLALCVHGHAHRWPQLEPVAALARVLDKGEYGDPRRFLQRARSRGCLRRCLVAFLLAKDLAGVDLPPEFETAIASDRLARRLATKASFQIQSSDRSGDTRLITTVWRALALDKPKDAVRFAVLQVLAPRDDGTIGGELSRSLLSSAHVRRIRYLQRSVRKH